MNNNPVIRTTIARIISGSVALAAAQGVMAQQQRARSASIEEVVVTGTRLARPDLTSNSPIATVSSEALAELNTITLETQLRNLPQFLPGATEFINNGNPGAATINLRGLGSGRTLVLMDGKRLPPYGFGSSVDVNLVPTAILERVDVVTGGASAVYGSDAISGVVNFVTKQDFEGLRLDSNYTEFGEGDGRISTGSITFGSRFADDRGHGLVSIGYTKRDEVYMAARPFSFYNLFPDAGLGDIQSTARRGGSSNAGATRANIPTLGNRWFTPDGNLVVSSALPQGTGGVRNSVYNYNPFNFFQVPLDRWQALSQLNFQLNDSVEVYGRVFAVTSSVPTELAPSAFFGGSTLSDFFVNIDNPFLTQAQRAVLITSYNATNPVPYSATAPAGSQRVQVIGIRRRLIELGNRVGISESTTTQLTAGVKGDLGSTGWSWDVSAQYGRTSNFSGLENDVSIARARNSLLATSTTACLSGGECVPANIFSGNGKVDVTTGLPMTGAISAAALNYIRANYYTSTEVEQRIVQGLVSGSLDSVKLPSAEAPLGVALGIDYFQNDGNYDPDDLAQFGGAMGQGGTSPPVAGMINSKEVFAELYLPLVSGQAGINNLALEGGARSADNNLSGRFTTWKAGLEYSPVAGYRVRAMLQKAIRAANLSEQFSPLSFGLVEVANDPCAGNNPVANAAVRAKCIAQGAPAARIGQILPPAAQQAASIGGGAIPNGVQLDPEEADTFTAGIQVNPESLPAFSASIDYYKIEVGGAIGSYPGQEIIDNCFNRNLDSFCKLIKRNVLGELEGDGFGIIVDTRNLATYNAEGVDYTAGYRFDLGNLGILGETSLDISLAGTYVLDSSFQSSPSSDLIECEGFYGDSCGGPAAKVKANLSAGLSFGDWKVGLTMRHFDKVTAQPGNEYYEIQSIPSFNYLDLSVQWRWNDTLRVNLSAQNLTDKDPPIVANISGGNTASNTYADYYDPLGRRLGLGVSLTF
jgi:outer membrane receptor protein involved in Fe transport